MALLPVTFPLVGAILGYMIYVGRCEGGQRKDGRLQDTSARSRLYAYVLGLGVAGGERGKGGFGGVRGARMGRRERTEARGEAESPNDPLMSLS